MAYLIDGKIGVNITDTSSTISDALGNRYIGSDSAQYIYVLSGAAIPASSYVTINETFTAIAGTKTAVDDGHEIGFAPEATVASGKYFYASLRGRPQLRVASLCAADVALYTTSTAGLLDDTATSQTKIDGIVIVTANATGSGTSTAIATWPRSATF